MIREESTWFICSALWDNSYNFYMKEGIFATSGEKLLVIHKNEIRLMRPQEVWDGMEIVILKEENIEHKIDRDSVVLWISIYEWFDENTSEIKYYAYWFDRSKIDWVQEVCNLLDIPVQLHMEKFVRLVFKQIQNNTVLHELSYLFWLALIYGHFDFSDAWLKHVKIHLPLEGSISAKEDGILAIITWLHKQWIYISHDYQDQKNGQLLQLNINDQELLDLWSKRLWGNDYDYSDRQQMIQEYLWNTITISNYVLKFLHK